jgi:predicted esterase
MDFKTGSQRLKNKDVYFVYGTKDPFLTDSRSAEMETLSEKLNAVIKTITFEGGHDIDETTLNRLSI